MNRAGIALLVAAVPVGALGGCSTESEAEGSGVRVEIAEPAEGATVSRPVRLVLQASGVEITPATVEREGTGHHHLFVDRDLTPAGDTMPRGTTGLLHLGSGQTEFFLDSLTPGEHRVIAVIGNWQHRPIPGLATDTVTFTVQ